MVTNQELPLSLNAALELITPFPPFPAEILLNIVELACTSAKNALTLCLVSKHFNALATPLLYRFVSARGFKEVQDLIDYLEKNPRIPPHRATSVSLGTRS